MVSRDLWFAVVAAVGHIAWAMWQAYQVGNLLINLETMGDPNGTGTMLLVALVLGLPWFVTTQEWRRWLSVPYALGAVVVAVLAHSRGV